MSGRLAALVVLSLELWGTRAARADGGAEQGGLARRTKPVRLELTYVWPEPLPPARPLIPPAGGAATSSAPAPSSSPPESDASGAQVALAILVTIVGDTTGILVTFRSQSILEGMIPMAIAPFAAGAVVCNVPSPWRGGPSTPERGGRCRATLAGALIGAAAGLLPGVLIIAGSGVAPKTEDAYHDWSNTQLSAAELTLLLYTIGMPLGTVIGYNVGGSAPPNPVIVPPVATAPLFTLRF